MQDNETKIKWRQFIAGDNDSYSWLYNKYVQTLYQYSFRFTSNPRTNKRLHTGKFFINCIKQRASHRSIILKYICLLP